MLLRLVKQWQYLIPLVSFIYCSYMTSQSNYLHIFCTFKCKVSSRSDPANDSNQHKPHPEFLRCERPMHVLTMDSELWYAQNNSHCQVGLFTDLDCCTLLGGCPYPNISAHRIPYLIKGDYRMPKPAHLDDDM